MRLGATIVTNGLFGLGALPLPLRRSLANAIGWILASIPWREGRICRLQIERFLAPPSASSLMRKVFQSVSLTFLESLNLDPILSGKAGHVQFDDWPAFQQWIDSSRGKVCLTGHVGNWDLLAAYMTQQGVPFHALGRPARGEIAQHFLERLRSRYGVKTLWRSDSAGVKAIVKELKEGRGIAALIDQDTSVSSIMVPFFGVPAKTPSALVDIAKRLGCTVAALFLVREGPSRYRILWFKLDDTKSSAEILAEFHARLEAVIRRYPEQWVWFHKRWRSQPDGSTLGSSAYIERLSREVLGSRI